MMIQSKLFLLAGLVGLAGCSSVQAGVTVSVLPAAPSGPQVVASYAGYDGGGNTSIAFDNDYSYKSSYGLKGKAESQGYFKKNDKGEWVEVPYFKRDRDLGQTFTYRGTTPAKLDAITVRTGYGTNSVRTGAYGQAIAIQIFQVNGTPVLNENGTTAGMSAAHGYPHNFPKIEHFRDNYYTGETYQSLAVATGGKFPDKTTFGFKADETPDPNDKRLKGVYLRWDLTGDAEITLQPGKVYAFVVMIEEIGANRGFTLANNFDGNYPDGHGIRRDGNGQYPPVEANPNLEFTDPANAAALQSAHFPTDFAKRTAIAPGTNGYPDVDTARDVAFWAEVQAAK